MSVKYFPKPQPLSPNTRTWVDSEGVRWEKDARVRGGKRRVKGAWCTDSIYYLWFEYLKRSSKYKSACANNGKGMQKLYKDFGDVYAYEGVEGFWKWWTDIGQYLFSSKPISNVSGFFTLDDVAEYGAEVEAEKILLLPIPTQPDWVVPNQGDAGAHVSLMNDSGCTSFVLSHWVRDKGTFSLPEAVRKLTSMPAGVLGLSDRGSLAVGKRADINVIDIDKVAERQPEIVHDMPFGAPRFIQRGQGYRATVCNGAVVLENDELTGDRAGRVIRSGGTK